MQQNERLSTSKGRKWELLNSLWIVLTFALGFFSWLAFVYIGLRARHPRWVLWAVLYATPLVLLLFFRPEPGSWQANLILSAILVLALVSIVHAFLVRKEYLLRLELLQRETGNVSVTSKGKRWELLHSLWIGWTFALGLFSWVAFIYIGIRARRLRWILWGLLYFTVFMVFAVVGSIAGPGSDTTNSTVALMIVVGIVSVVHAFLVRNDYLVRLENRVQEAAETEAMRWRRLEAEYSSRTEEPPPSESFEQPKSVESSATTDAGPREPAPPKRAVAPPPTTVPALAPVEINTSSGSKTNELLQATSILDS